MNTKSRTEMVALTRLAMPLVAAQLLESGIGFVDTIMIGRVGPVELAAIAMGNSVWITLMLFGKGVLMAISPSVASLRGAGQHEEITPVVRQGLWLGLALGGLVFVALRHARSVFVLAGIEASVIPIACDYLDAVSWGIPAYLIAAALRLFSEGIARTTPVLWVSLVGLVVNIVGNTVLIFGAFGLPPLGARGCGIATAIGMWCCLAAWLLVMSVSDHHRAHGLFSSLSLPSWRRMRALLHLGLPIGFSILLEAGIFSAVAFLLGRIGAVATAAHQVAINVAAMTFMVPQGLGMATTVRVGHAMGAGDLAEARFRGFLGIKLAILFMTAMSVLIFVARRTIAGVYTGDASVIDLAAELLQWVALFQISDGLQVAAGGALRGLKDTRIPLAMVLVAYWAVAFPLAWFSAPSPLGANGPWLALIAGLTVAAVLLTWRFSRKTQRMIGQTMMSQRIIGQRR
ncbi:MAG: MATE family efflux transporter [Deltaproteobacteria bacterium]|nr:MATE family efflux transporter [Deltaproteobacteria bacterium]